MLLADSFESWSAGVTEGGTGGPVGLVEGVVAGTGVVSSSSSSSGVGEGTGALEPDGPGTDADADVDGPEVPGVPGVDCPRYAGAGSAADASTSFPVPQRIPSVVVGVLISVGSVRPPAASAMAKRPVQASSVGSVGWENW